MSKAKEFRDQSLEELKATYQEQCKQLFELNHAFKYQKKREKPHEHKHARKTIARLLTVITEKQNANKDQSAKG